MLALMKRAGYPATGFTPHLIRWLSTTAPSILPGAWGGCIPPITTPDRHKKLDAYVSRQGFCAGSGPLQLLDIGCGFPPLTAADTARNLPQWKVCGVDRSFADYLLIDGDGHYACFDLSGRFLYFQAMMNISGKALYANPAAARRRFKNLFAALQHLLPPSDGNASTSIQKDGLTLIYKHIKDFESDNLRFIQSDIEDLDGPTARVVRCMNVLLYFKTDEKKRLLAKLADLLETGGILIAGTNGMGIQARYTVYEKDANGLFPREFAFSLDNLGDIAVMPYFTIHENDAEAMLLADLSRTIRNDRLFWSDFCDRLDGILEQRGFCRRRSDGFLEILKEAATTKEYLKNNLLLWNQMGKAGYADMAVDVLIEAGYNAWKNPVGDIAIQPPVDYGKS
jgi:SAM-dependent methyltransferase